VPLSWELRFFFEEFCRLWKALAMSQGFILLLIEKPNVKKTGRFPFQEQSGYFASASTTRTTSGFQGLWFPSIDD
jgi:hypothetical protein